MKGFVTRLYVPLALMASPVLLAGCAETELFVHTAKQLQGPASERDKLGVYKVGAPYKIAGSWYHPKIDYRYSKTGIASWYGPKFHGKKTANGAIFDQNAVSAAHKTLPLPSRARVTNLENGRSISVLVNDRGPFVGNRIIDLSRRSAQLLGFQKQGTARVRVTVMEDESRTLASVASGKPPPVRRAATRPEITQVAAVERAAVKTERLPLADADPLVTVEPVGPNRIFIQAGAFSQIANANRLRNRLSSYGTASVTHARIENRDFYRVRIGPLSSVDQGDRVLSQVIAAGEQNARIVVD